MIARLVLLALLIPSAATAQSVRPDLAERGATDTATVRVGAESAFVATLDYAHATAVLGRGLVFDAEVTVPWDGLDVEDFQARAGATLGFAHGRWRLDARLAPTIRGTHQIMGRLTGIGADASLIGGYYARRWFAAVEAGLDGELATHITHSDAYRTRVYQDARDGWYAANSGILRGGVQLGVSFGHDDVALRVGAAYTTTLAPTLLPGFATLAWGRRW